MNLEFSTVDPERAKEILSSEAYRYLTSAQKAFVLSNLGKMRVRDPLMHSPGISCSSQELAIEFAKLGVIDDSFIWTHSCFHVEPVLIGLALDNGIKLPKTALMKAIESRSIEAIDLYIDRKLITKSELQEELSLFAKDLKFILDICNKYGFRRFTSHLWADYLSAADLLRLCDEKLISREGLKYNHKQKYLEVGRLKKIRKSQRG